MSRAAILTIGTELTRGDLQDQNGFWLAAELAELGHDVFELRTIDDDEERIVATLVELGARYDLLLVTGGLGPTSDDLTASAAARASQKELVRDARSLERIARVFQRSGASMHPMNAKQADFPEGALILDNDVGTAPGFACAIGRSTAYFTPGVPREMQHLFAERIAPRLPQPSSPLSVRRLTVYGLPESAVAGKVESVESAYPVVLGYRASAHEIEVKVQTRARADEPPAAACERASAATALAEELLQGALVAPGRVPLPAFFGAEMRRRGLTVGLAESCTGGLVSQLITSIAGSSEYFLGGIVSYDNRIKTSLLGVPPSTLETVGAVSAECALAMAQGAQQALGVDLAIAITGIAGPSGGSPEKPVGLVYFCALLHGRTLEKKFTFRGDRAQIQRRAATSALVLGLEHLRATE